jgi:hypothetical protein
LAETKCSQRPAEPCGRVRDQHLFGVEQHDLGAETAAHVGRDDLHLLGGESEEPAQSVLDGDGRLGGVPDPQHALARVPVREDAARLHRHPAGPLQGQVQPLDVLGRGEHGVRVADTVADDAGDVVRHVVVNGGRRLPRPFQLDDRLERLVLHAHQLGGVLGEVPVVGDHHRDRLAHVAHAVDGERELGLRREQRGVPGEQGQRLVQLAEVGTGEHEPDAGSAAGRLHVEQRDPAVGHHAPHERGVDGAGAMDVVDVPSGSDEQPVVLLARGRPPDPAGCGLDLRGHEISSAAGAVPAPAPSRTWSTARVIPT